MNKNSDTQLDVILTNGWDRISYNILRSLSKAGLKVGFGVDSNSGMGKFSRLAKQPFFHTSYLMDEEKFIDDIINYIKKTNAKVYIPTGEEIFAVAKHINKFNPLNVAIPISSYNILLKLHNKIESVRLAESLKLPVPKTILPTCIEEIQEFGKEFGHPIIIKVLYSSSSKGIFYLKEKDTDKIGRFLRYNKLDFNNFLMQQHVEGRGYGVSMLMGKGNLTAKFTHRRLREKYYLGGPSTLRESTKSEELEKYAEKLLSSIQYDGVAMVEFKYNEKENKAWLIDVNPRFWGSIGLAINAGVDFPMLLYKMAIGELPAYKNTYKEGIRYKWLLGDILGLVEIIRYTHKISSIKELFEKVDGYDDYYKDDRFAFYASIALYIRRYIRRFFG